MPHQGAADLRDVQPRGAQGLGKRTFTSAPWETLGLRVLLQIHRGSGGAIVIAAETVLVLVLGSRSKKCPTSKNFEVSTVATLPYRLEHGGAGNSVANTEDALCTCLCWILCSWTGLDFVHSSGSWGRGLASRSAVSGKNSRE